MQWSFHINFLATLCSAFDNFEISCNGPPLLIVHVPCSFVANPGVGASPTRVHPHDVLEPEIISQGHIDDFDCHCDEGPAFVADVCLIAACPNLVIIRKIDIEDELFGQRSECG